MPTDPDKTAADGLPPLRQVINNNQLWADKALGQNFILDLNLTRKIARLSAPLSEKTIVEIGPGPGGLTRALLFEGAKHVIAVERDSRCLPVLDAISAAYPQRLSIIHADALAVDWHNIIGGHSQPIYIIANLPYGIATRLLINWLETAPWPPWFDGMVLMFQKEVAERIVARPQTKPYGRLSVIAQWRTTPQIALTLAPAAFTPPPKIASAVVTFAPIANPKPSCSVTTLGRLTAAAFGQRRKMLRTSLRQVVPHPELLLAKAEIDPRLRSEQLSPEDFAHLAVCLDGETQNTA